MISGTDVIAYNALRDELVATMEAIAKDREALGAAPLAKTQRLPALDDLLRHAGGWSRIVRESEVALQRPVLDALVQSIRLIRLRRTQYTADIEWTPLGAALSQPQHLERAGCVSRIGDKSAHDETAR
jgi:hypothetical protein